MNKEQKSILVEFVKKLSNEDLRYVGTRLNERYADDLAQVLDFLSKSEDVDVIFSSTNSASALYDYLDFVRESVNGEAKSRGKRVSYVKK